MCGGYQSEQDVKRSYSDWLKQDLVSLIDSLEISALKKHFLKSRWLDQVIWMAGKSDSAKKRYVAFRLTAIIGGVIVPALVSLNISSDGAMTSIRWLTFGISLLVAISVAVEEFFHYGDRWRHYRRTVECLKIEGWQFLQLSGSYKDFEDHAEAYSAFAGRVEGIQKREVDMYITEVMREKKKEKEAENE